MPRRQKTCAYPSHEAPVIIKLIIIITNTINTIIIIGFQILILAQPNRDLTVLIQSASKTNRKIHTLFSTATVLSDGVFEAKSFKVRCRSWRKPAAIIHLLPPEQEGLSLIFMWTPLTNKHTENVANKFLSSDKIIRCNFLREKVTILLYKYRNETAYSCFR